MRSMFFHVDIKDIVLIFEGGTSMNVPNISFVSID